MAIEGLTPKPYWGMPFTQGDFETVASWLRIDEPMLWIVVEYIWKGCGFSRDKFPAFYGMDYEEFFDALGGKITIEIPTTLDILPNIVEACPDFGLAYLIDSEKAISASAFGLGFVQGKDYSEYGYSSAMAMWNHACLSEGQQLWNAAKKLAHNEELLVNLREKNWLKIAPHVYPDYFEYNANRMEKSYADECQRKSCDIRSMQMYLWYLGIMIHSDYITGCYFHGKEAIAKFANHEPWARFEDIPESIHKKLKYAVCQVEDD